MSLLQIALDINEIPKDQQFISSEKYINQYLAAMTPQWQKIPRLYVDLMRKSGKIMIKNASFIELKAENSKEKHMNLKSNFINTMTL
jgi:hypothetical protein